MTNLKEMHDLGCDIGKRSIRMRNTVGSFFLVSAEPRPLLISTPWTCPEEKPVYIGAMRQILEEEKIEAYTFVAEAWLASYNPRVNPELANISPRNRSQREDVVIVMSRSRSGESLTTKFVIDYDAEGKATLGPQEDMNDTGGTGLMENLFDEAA